MMYNEEELGTVANNNHNKYNEALGKYNTALKDDEVALQQLSL